MPTTTYRFLNSFFLGGVLFSLRRYRLDGHIRQYDHQANKVKSKNKQKELPDERLLSGSNRTTTHCTANLSGNAKSRHSHDILDIQHQDSSFHMKSDHIPDIDKLCGSEQICHKTDKGLQN